MSVIFEMESPFRSPYQLHQLTFGSGGPVVAIVAGLHGNELNSIHALNMLAAGLRMQKLRGTVLLFPLINTFGADECRKRLPFGDQDINKLCPGDPNGSPAERIAHALVQATSKADVCIDVHSGAAHVREIPQVRCPLSGYELELARTMNLPVIWRRSGLFVNVSGLVGAWRSMGKTAFRVIGGRGITLDNRLASKMAAGLLGLLSNLGVMNSMMNFENIVEVTNEDIEFHRARCGGFFVPEVRVGERVQPGRLLGYLQSPIGGDRLDEIRAKNKGIVMTLRANPMIHAQELLVRIAHQE